MFNDSLLSIPKHPWSSKTGSRVTSLAPLDFYVWYRDQYTSVRPPSVARPWYLPIVETFVTTNPHIGTFVTKDPLIGTVVTNTPQISTFATKDKFPCLHRLLRDGLHSAMQS